MSAGAEVLAPAATRLRPCRPSFLTAVIRGDHGVLVRGLSLTATLLGWEWYGRGVDPLFMSYPTAIVAAVPRMLRSGELLDALASSVVSLAIGVAFAVVFGVLIGLLTGRYRLVDQLLDVQISALYSTPNVALIPLMILWFGLGTTSKVVIVFLRRFSRSFSTPMPEFATSVAP